MEKLIIKGASKLNGEVVISGAKNSSLPILAATILAEGTYHIDNIPALRDINTMFKLLENVGVSSEFKNNSAVINNKNTDSFEAPYELVKTMRASIVMLGPLVAKKGKAKVSLPGGCAIGERPVDLHIAALEKMGAKIEVKDGYIFAECEKLQGVEIVFDKVTVTGTENIMMAASLASGTTILKNAAQEPEVQDLAVFLRKMGADIEGDGTNTIIIKGKEKLHSADHSIMPDRIEAGTFLCAVAGVGGDITLKKCPVKSMDAIIEKLRLAGLQVNIIDDETKYYFLNLIIDCAKDDINLIIEAIDFSAITKEEIDNMNPKNIHDVFNSFAKKYLNRLKLYGIFGGAVGVLLVIMKCVNTVNAEAFDIINIIINIIFKFNISFFGIYSL